MRRRRPVRRWRSSDVACRNDRLGRPGNALMASEVARPQCARHSPVRSTRPASKGRHPPKSSVMEKSADRRQAPLARRQGRTPSSSPRPITGGPRRSWRTPARMYTKKVPTTRAKGGSDRGSAQVQSRRAGGFQSRSRSKHDRGHRTRALGQTRQGADGESVEYAAAPISAVRRMARSRRA